MITTIPPDVAVRILSFIDSSDVINVMLTCKYFSDILKDDYIWRLLLEHRIPRKRIDSLNSDDYPTYKQKYFELTRRRHYGVQLDHVGIAWGNDQRYWHPQEDANGECGRIMHLRSVCWFDIQTVFNVPNGTWYVVWRIRRESNWDISFGAAEKVGTSNDRGRQIVKAHFPRSQDIYAYTNAPFERYYLPTPITINSSSGFGDINVSAARLTGEWKYGFDLDYIEVISEEEKRALESPQTQQTSVGGGLMGAIRRLAQIRLAGTGEGIQRMLALALEEEEEEEEEEEAGQDSDTEMDQGVQFEY